MRVILLFAIAIHCGILKAQPAFKVIPLGVKGGIDEQNLSSYLIAPSGADRYVALDAGTLYAGIQKAVSVGSFKGPAELILKENVKAYFISHAHLDHVSGLILNSADDVSKNIYAFPKCMEIIKNHYFNWDSWPNFGNDGNPPVLRKYKYNLLNNKEEVAIENTDMFVTGFPLSHSNPYESAAFLLRSGNSYVLYFGDTGPDEVEKTDRIAQVWQAVAPLVREGKVKGIFLEVSYTNEQPDNKLYGHMTPKWFMKTIEGLETLCGKGSLRDVQLIVTHIKPTGENERSVREQMREANSNKYRLLFPEQGVRFDL
jgi:cAMP phosphodiesterase